MARPQMDTPAPPATTSPRDAASDFFIATLDVGTSSVRTMLFDRQACELDGFGAHVSYHVSTTPDGGVEVDADQLAELCIDALSELHAQIESMNQTSRRQLAAVACCTFWHNVLGVGADDRPTTPVIHLFDTRSTAAARKLAQQIDAREQHARTGCVLHPSYVPAKLLWLSENLPEAFRATRRWMSFGEYLFLRLFGRAAASVSMVSGSGLWNQNQNAYDDGILGVLPIERSQLTPVEEMDEPLTELQAEYKALWPSFAGARWYPAFGDGACNNIGSGCSTPVRFALMVGTSGAMRVVLETSHIEIPEGLWCYRVDRKRFVLGGALSNGGLVFEWMKRTLALPSDNEEIEEQLAAMMPDSHGLTVVPLFAGERSTKWRAEARAAFAGMSMNTRPVEILRAGLEAVALRFRNIYDLMVAELGRRSADDTMLEAEAETRDPVQRGTLARVGVPGEVIASGGGLLHSPAWTQMMADALGRPVVPCLEKEATSRGAALLILERLGAIRGVSQLPACMAAAVNPVEGHKQAYENALRRQRHLYAKLYEEDGIG